MHVGRTCYRPTPFRMRNWHLPQANAHFSRSAYAPPPNWKSSLMPEAQPVSPTPRTPYGRFEQLPRDPLPPSLNSALALGASGVSLFALPPTHDSMGRLLATIADAPYSFAGAYVTLCAIVGALHYAIKHHAHRIDSDRTRAIVKKLDPGIIVMSAGASVAGIEMVYNVGDTGGTAFQHALGDLTLSGAFIMSIMSIKRLTTRCTTDTPAGTTTILKGANLFARLACLTDDALLPILTATRWGIL